MNCPKCNTPLVNGNCPNCHYDGLDELDGLEEVEQLDELDDIDSLETNEELDSLDVLEEMTLEQKSDVKEIDDPSNITNDIQKKNKKFAIKINKDAKMSTIVAIIFIAIFFFVGILLGQSLFSKTIVRTINPSINKNTIVTDGKKNITTVGGVTYSIPEKYIYDKNLNGILVYDPDDSFRIFMRADTGNYKKLTTSITSIKETLKLADINVINVKETKVSDTNILAIECSTKLVNRLMVYMEASQSKVYFMEIVTNKNDFNYDVLGLAIDILKNAKLDDKVSSMEKIEVKDVSKIGIAAANTYTQN